MENIMDSLLLFATTYGIKVVGAIVVLIIGRFVAGLMRGFVKKSLNSRGTDPAIAGFTSSMVYYLIIIFTVMAVMKNVGIETASLVAVLGAAGFAVGFALQGSLSNFAAGVLLLIFRPYKIGDFVDVAGVAGTVKDMGIFTTTLNSPDNIRILVPNGKVFGDTIKNITAEDTRRIDLVIGIGYGSSIEKAQQVLAKLIAADNRILRDPAPQIAVSELADSSVNLVVRPWVKTSDYWGVRLDLMREIKEAFDKDGIEIPFPQRVVHNISENTVQAS